jgi:hypothetical protein
VSHDRFRNLERARPAGPDDAAKPASSRFERIEARRDEPPPADDPFAPPPLPELGLEVRADDVLAAKRMHAERDARANAAIHAEAEALEAEREMRLAARGESSWLIAMDRRTRAYWLVGAIAVSAALTAVIGPAAWALAIAVAIVLAMTGLARS